MLPLGLFTTDSMLFLIAVHLVAVGLEGHPLCRGHLAEITLGTLGTSQRVPNTNLKRRI
jgi:hypothetical protein